ncbi:hypothetical protein HUK65_13495 [Rhodobacteraceae bacterium 2376]|uniref:Uncharacterized protein n=1 Tax=Rhabdonatronobacter sediminivivens TaxID=2743469 RepID=A0A7Z0I148_9RHOB|nr:hypothetical protein [Rhabdonatronobacter sediminivivens]NYS26004.1 hypothetical protein [Rhabdonatronobacter sediminivivens]
MDRTGDWRLVPACDLSFSRGPGGKNTLLIAGEARRPGRAQIDAVAAKAEIRLKRAAETVEKVDGVVAECERHAQETEVPSGLLSHIAESLVIVRCW